MQIGFNAPTSGSLIEPDSLSRIVTEGEALGFERTGGDHRQDAAWPGQLRQRQRVGRGSQRRQIKALARIGQYGERQRGLHGIGLQVGPELYAAPSRQRRLLVSA